MKIVPFRAEHLRQLQVQNAQLKSMSWMPADQAETIEQLGAIEAYTAIEGDRVVGCAGVLELWKGRAAAWAFLAGDLGRKFVPFHRAVKRFLAVAEYSRIEAEVALDFDEGHRWARILGFELENPRMRKYFPDGSDAALYVKVK